MNRIDRLSAILIMLQSSSIVRVKQIANRFGISMRTVYRDIKALEEVGIPITGGSHDGYSLVEGYKLPPLMFTQEEAFAFLAAEKLVDRFTDSGFRESHKSGIEKIRAVMRLAQKEDIGNIESKIATLDFQQRNPNYSQNILQVIMNGIAKHKRIQISYFSYNNQEVTTRTVDPIGIFFSLSNWYMIAYCNTKKSYRTFRINRIKDIQSLDEASAMKHPSLDVFLKSLKDTESLQRIIIEVDKDNISLIDESRYYQGLVSEKEIKGKVELQFMVFSAERFARWLMSYVDIARVITPSELKRKMVEILTNSKLLDHDAPTLSI